MDARAGTAVGAGPSLDKNVEALRDFPGKPQSLVVHRGQWVLVNFWATWCRPCRQEIPELVRLQHDESGKLAIIGIAVSYRDPDAVLAFAREHGIDYPVVLGNEDVAAEFGGFEGLPSSFLYGPDGVLVRRFAGPQTEASIEQAMGLSPH